jgi:hypothetical protein
MSLDPNTEAEAEAPESDGQQLEPQADSAAPVEQPAPQERTYSQQEFNYHMGRARKSFEADAQRRQEAAINAAQIEWQQRFDEWAKQSTTRERYVPQDQPKQDPNSPWARFDPDAADALRSVLSGEIESAVAPYRQQIAASNLAAEEAKLAGQYPDYQKVRAHVLNFAVANRILDLDLAYKAFKYQDRAAIERDAIAGYVKKKVRQSSQTPSVEGRGGGAPSSKQGYKNRDQMDEAAAQLFRASQD